MAAALHYPLISLPDEPWVVRSENSFLKCAEANFDLDNIFLEAESQPLLDDPTMLDFMLEQNVNPFYGSPSTELQPNPAEPRDEHQVHLRQGPEAKKRRRIESIIVSERLRRKKARHMLSTLHSLLKIPTATKLSRHCLIEEAAKYIQSLQIRLRELKTKREQLQRALASNPYDQSPNDCERRLPLTSSSMDHNVSVNVFDREVIVRITSFRMPRHLWRIYQELEANNLDVQRADVYAGESVVFLHFHANCSVQASILIQSKLSLQFDFQCIY